MNNHTILWRRIDAPGHEFCRCEWRKAAWLRFPDFTFEGLEQHYRRLDEDTYRYTSAGGQFSADLKVNKMGFVTHYPGYVQVVAESAAQD